MEFTELIKMLSPLGCLLFLTSSLTKSEPLHEKVNVLLNKLLTGHNVDVIPVDNHTDIVDIQVISYLYDITNIDPIDGTYAVRLSNRIAWHDGRITWEPGDVGENVIISKQKVWTPAMFFPTSVNYDSFDGPWHVKYSYKGDAELYTGQTVRNHCDFNMKYWPFDKQTCLLSIGVMDTIEGQNRLVHNGTAVDITHLRMTEWEMENVDVYTGYFQRSSYIAYKLQLKRKSAFYVLTTLLPIAFIGFLQPFVFLLPSEAGERVGFSITIMLSISVFFTVISEQIPKTGDPMALICVYVMLLTVSSVTMTICVIFNLQVYHRSGTSSISAMFLRLHKLISCLCCNNRSNVENQTRERINGEGSIKNEPVTAKSGNEDDGSMVAIKDNREISRKYGPVTWCDVSCSIDKLLFIISVLCSVIPSFVFLIYLKQASVYLELEGF